MRIKLAESGIETRPFFYPMHTLPMYSVSNKEETFPVSEKIAARGLNLPSSSNLTPEDIVFICQQINELCRPC